MMNSNQQPAPQGPPASMLRNAFDHLWRATWLLCPRCGTQPLFLPLKHTRNLHDWLTPLKRCEHCHYDYERAPGYFLLPLWGLAFYGGCFLAILIYTYLLIWHHDLSTLRTTLTVVLPLPIVLLLLIRHAKAYFLAINRFFEPEDTVLSS